MKNTNLVATISLLKEELNKAIIGLDKELTNPNLVYQEKEHIQDLRLLCEELLETPAMNHNDSGDFYEDKHYSSDDYYNSNC